MARQVTAWCEALEKEAEATGLAELLTPLSPREFFRLELGLFFLAQHLPGQPARVLRQVLDGYITVGTDGEPTVRRVRYRLGPTARSGQWRVRLNEYCKVPVHLRMFELEDPDGDRVLRGSVFRRRSSSYLPGREAAYWAALTDPVDYVPVTLHDPAPVGEPLAFRRADGSRTMVRFPDWVQALAQPLLLQPRQQRAREPFEATGDDLAQAAKEMDEALHGDPRYSGEQFSQRLEGMRFAAPDREAGLLREGLGVFAIDGVAHLVGLMNSGKTTFNDIVVFLAVKRRKRVGYVVASVSDALEKVRFFRALGIRAVPLIGQKSFGEHVDRHWDDVLHADPGAGFPDGQDAAAAYATDVCLLEQLLPGGPVGRERLESTDRPCRGKLWREPVEGKRRRYFDCPLIGRCPAHRASRDIPEADVWVMTPAALLSSRAEPASYKARWLIAAQHELDLMVVDEADRVMNAFDDKFMHYQPLTLTDGWSSRSAVNWNEGLSATTWQPLMHKDGQYYHRRLIWHADALGGLYPLLPRSSRGEEREEPDALGQLVEDGPFSGFTVLMHLARLLHGIEGYTERPEDSSQWEAAEVFFENHFGPLVRDPFDQPLGQLAPLVHAMTASYDTDPQAVEVAAAAWLNKHAPKLHTRRARDDAVQAAEPEWPGELVRLLVAGIWAARITTSFFQLSAREPAVRALAPLVESGGFVEHQPPADLLALVPEQPMGNMLALQWKPNREGRGSLHVMWVRGVGRWLLYHLHDLLACEGVEGPNVLLTSATSTLPDSARYYIDIPPSLVLLERPESRAALHRSRLFVRPQHRPGYERGIFVSGAGGRRLRAEAVRALTEAIATPAPGAATSLLDQVRSRLEEDRRKVAFITLSSGDAETSAYLLNTKTAVSACHVVRDSEPPGRYGLLYRRISTFGTSEDEVIVGPEGSLGRGHNILNKRKRGALGAFFYLTRMHPPPDDVSFPLAVLNARAMHRLLRPYRYGVDGEDTAKWSRQLVHDARQTWQAVMGGLISFRSLRYEYLRRAFVADLLISLYQTIGRGIRGFVPVLVYLVDAAFAPRHANPREKALDTERTSVLVAGRQLIRERLAPPPADATAATRLQHHVLKASWGLLENLFETMDWG